MQLKTENATPGTEFQWRLRGRCYKLGHDVPHQGAVVPASVIAGRYFDPKEIIPHLFAEIDPGFHERCKPGDIISIKDKSKEIALVLEATQSGERDLPDYLEVDHNKMTAAYVRRPGLADVPYPVVSPTSATLRKFNMPVT